MPELIPANRGSLWMNKTPTAAVQNSNANEVQAHTQTDQWCSRDLPHLSAGVPDGSIIWSSAKGDLQHLPDVQIDCPPALNPDIRLVAQTMLSIGAAILLLVVPGTNSLWIYCLRLVSAGLFLIASTSVILSYQSDGIMVGACFFLLASTLAFRACQSVSKR